MQSVNSPPSCPPWWYYAEVNAHYILMSRDHHDYHLCHLSMCTVVQVYIWRLFPSEFFCIARPLYIPVYIVIGQMLYSVQNARSKP